MNRYLIPLKEVQLDDADQVGTKAAALGSLMEAGFPVPPGLCVTTSAFRLATEPWSDQIDSIICRHDLLNPAGASAAAESLEMLLVNLVVPAPVMLALSKTLPTIVQTNTPLAVRSSATAEDSAEVSFAGQYRSVIGVLGKDALQSAIVEVWRSFYSANALNARAAAGRLDSKEAMAVLILPMINAECAGVALSKDPVAGRGDRVVVSAAWGLGAGVVDGSVATDTTWVRRNDATEGFEIEEQRIVEQAEQIALDSTGVLQRLPVPEKRRRAACLPRSWLLRVAQFCVAAEVLFSCPQDMEWAIVNEQVWILQSRPITALPPELAHTPRFPVVWKNEQERQTAWILYPYWRHVLKPLEVDYTYDRVWASRDSSQYTGGERAWAVKIVNGRAFATWLANDLAAGDRRVRRAALADLVDRLHRQNITTWEYWGPEVIKATERLAAFDPSNADGAQLAEHLEDARGVFRRHWAIHGARLSYSLEPLYAAYAAVSGLEESAVREFAGKLLEGEENSSTQLIDELYGMAQAAQKVPTIAELITNLPADVLDRLSALPEAAPFRERLAEFLQHFGDHSGVGYGSDTTIDFPTWREDPVLVLRFVAPYLNPAVEAPAVIRARARAERDAMVAALCEACDDQEAVATLKRELAYARRAAAFMEEHNHYIDQMMNGQLRHAILAAGRRLVEHGVLQSVDEIFWLYYHEILSMLRTDLPSSHIDVIAARQRQHAEWVKLAPPPLLGIPSPQLGRRPPPQDEVTETSPERTGQITGLGASPGRHRGRARIVATSVLLPDLSPGEVLVAQNAGPRWTPLIPILGGLVLDGGAVGQHHAIAAREYGVPAVVSTGNATQRIPDGAWITVDGTAGTVEIETLSRS